MNDIILVLIPSLIGGGGLIATICSTIVQLKKLRAETAERASESQKEQQKQFAELQKTTQKSIVDLESSMNSVLTNHRNEYLAGVQEVKDATTDLKASYQTSIATISMQIESLEKKQDKHNSVIERVYKLESDVNVLDNREKVSEHRLSDIEADRRKMINDGK